MRAYICFRRTIGSIFFSFYELFLRIHLGNFVVLCATSCISNSTKQHKEHFGVSWCLGAFVATILSSSLCYFS